MSPWKERKTQPVMNQPAGNSNLSASLLHNDCLAVPCGRLCLRVRIGVEECPFVKLLLSRRYVLIERPAGFRRRFNAQSRHRK